MINQQHPIIPPEDLLQQLRRSADTWLGQITIAYQAGADQELDADCKWLFENDYPHKVASVYLRKARRPKPLSLKEQALALLQPGEPRLFNSEMQDTIRHALEALPND
jgi:hypothetical protein